MKLRILPKPVPTPTEPDRPVRKAFLLCEAPTRERLRIISVHLPSLLRRPLEQMDLVPGRHVRLLFNDHKGTVVLERKGDSFILGRKETRHIRVETVPATSPS